MDININKGLAVAALCAFLGACAPSPRAPAADAATPPGPKDRLPGSAAVCAAPGDVTGMEYYQSTKQAYLDAGMDDGIATYLAHTATAMMTCIWQEEFSQFAGRTCSVELDFTGALPEKHFAGDREFCAFIEKQIAPVVISPPPADYLRQHKKLTIEFTPG
ncbi:hypothetical protein [Acerihabitans arboris]|uniref:Uncharacterized protein n=1 Tax=Acerihabitans arboris TaxID=2691583 RepID=A0A845SLR0_9GAMM|nr:hypothetical protein [Acerihabitans arboris]NDL63914.1 hypothetical protein [Acerihabitans arboris]